MATRVSTPESCGLLSFSSPSGPRLVPVFQLTKLPSGIIILRRISQLLCPASICCANIYCNLCEKQRFMITFGNWVVIYIIYIVYILRKGGLKRIRPASGLMTGQRGQALTRLAMSHGSKSFPQSCAKFLNFFSFSHSFFLFLSCFAFRAQSLFNCLFQLLLSSHLKVFRYCCKYFVKNGIQSVSKMLLTKQTGVAIREREGVHSCPGQGKSIVNWAQVSGVYGWASKKFFFFFIITNPGKISPMQQMSIVSFDKVILRNEVFSFAMPCKLAGYRVG